MAAAAKVEPAAMAATEATDEQAGRPAPAARAVPAVSQANAANRACLARQAKGRFSEETALRARLPAAGLLVDEPAHLDRGRLTLDVEHVVAADPIAVPARG